MKRLGHIDRNLKKGNSGAVRRKAVVGETQRSNRQAKYPAVGKIEMSALCQ
jgi:hypothetical protein